MTSDHARLLANSSNCCIPDNDDGSGGGLSSGSCPGPLSSLWTVRCDGPDRKESTSASAAGFVLMVLVLIWLWVRAGDAGDAAADDDVDDDDGTFAGMFAVVAFLDTLLGDDGVWGWRGVANTGEGGGGRFVIKGTGTDNDDDIDNGSVP